MELRPVFSPTENEDVKTSSRPASTSSDALPSTFDVTADDEYVNSG